MAVASLAHILGDSGLELDAEQIADVLWLLAAHEVGSTYSDEPLRNKPGSPESDQKTELDPVLTKDDRGLSRLDRKDSNKSPRVALHLHGGAGSGSMAASIVALPGTAALTDALLLSRSLRPFRRYIDSHYLSSIDVEATVEATAEARRLLVILTSQSERWLDVALVADAGSSMIVWRDILDDLERILAQVGAFRCVSRWELLTDSDPVCLRDIQGAAHPLERLIDPSGRRLVLVVSDGVSSGWYSELTWTALECWASVMPIAIVQVLPTSYWPDTGVGDPTVRLRATVPGSANSKLIISWPWWTDREDSGPAPDCSNPVPIPVVPLTAKGLTGWAESIVSGTSWTDGVLTKTYRPPLVDVEATLTGVERVRAFRQRASYGAQRLARILSSAPRLSIPLIRVLQARLAPDTGTSELAEVFVNGLLQREGSTQQSGYTCYVFREGVRELLSRGITGLQEWDVFSAVSNYLAEQVGASSSRALVALIADPVGRETLSSHDEPFAGLVGELASRLGLIQNTSGTGGADSRVIDRDVATAQESRGAEQQFNVRSHGPMPKYVAELIVTYPGGRRRASGYRVTPEAVLTAAHVVNGAVSVQVRFEPDLPSEWATNAVSWWADWGSDMAVVSIHQRSGEEPVNPAQFGRISDQVAVLNVQAVGFPRWKMRPEYRDSHYAAGSVAVLSRGTLEVPVMMPPAQDPDPEVSPWEGMSGAALWVEDRIVGVLAKHHRRDGLGWQAAIRLDLALDKLTSARRSELRELLPLLPEHSVQLPDVIPPPPRRAITQYQALVGDIAPDQLYGRDVELAQLVRFCASDESYAWWQAEPWAGKTALLSWFVLHPPAGVDVVSFFITGRSAGQSDSDAFTDALIEQLAALLGGSSQALTGRRPSPRHGQMLRLLQAAGRRCAEEGRQLLLVVDGLDEDTRAAAGVGRPSIASLLPRSLAPRVRALVASRWHPELPDDVPYDHPLRAILPRQLAPSLHAHGVEIRARAEVTLLLQGPPFQRDVLGLITASDGGLTQADLKELTDWPRFELERFLGGQPFGRIFDRKIPEDPDGRSTEPVYLHAHEALRDASLQALGDNLNGYLRRIHEWASSYINQGFPYDIPHYLLKGYPRLLVAQGDVGRAIRYQRALADSDNAASPQAMVSLGALLQEQGEVAAAQSMFQRAAAAGDSFAAERLAALLAQVGDVEALRELADAGNEYAARQLAERLAQVGDVGAPDIVSPQVEDASPALPAAALTVRAEAIVGIVGHARAGKTRLAAAVAERFGDASVVGFGDAVRGRAKVTQRVVDSDVLIEVGTKWVQRDPLGFCREVLNQQLGPSRLLLVEGIHHDVIRDALTHLVAPVPIRFVILKTPEREIVDRFQGEGKTAEQAARVLTGSTEIDVDRALLAKADLVLDGTHPVLDNVDRVITLVQQLSEGGEPAATIVGGLDRQQRSELVEAVAAEFKWHLPAEAAEVLDISIQQIRRLHEQRELLGLQINGSLLYPSFTIVGHEPNPAVAIVLRLLSPVMSDWELVAWLIADNGYLDGARPIDQPAERIQVAVDAELSNG